MRKSKRASGEDYYEYCLLYVDDRLMISDDPKASLDRIGKYFTLKEGSVGEPKLYLGARISKVQLPNGVVAWAWSPSKYIQESIRNLEVHLGKKGLKLRKGVNTPLSNGYCPEVDVSPVCSEDDSHIYTCH